MNTTRIRTALRFLNEERGAVSTEYGLLLVFIAVAIVAAATAFGVAVSGLFDTGKEGIPSAGS
jgi:Flp pilus assembly pilin Flp